MLAVAALVVLGLELRLWTRDADAGTLYREGAVTRVEHRGQRDWSLETGEALRLKGGDIVELRAVGRRLGRASLSASVFDAGGQSLGWLMGSTLLSASERPQLTVARFVAPPRAATFHPRIVGEGPGTAWVSELKGLVVGNIEERSSRVPARTTVTRRPLRLTVLRSGDVEVLDLRNRRAWHTSGVERGLVPIQIKASGASISVTGIEVQTALERTATFTLDGDQVRITLQGEGVLSDLGYPGGFATPRGSTIVVPMNEGIGYPVEDPATPNWTLEGYGGHGICMPWWGVVDRGAACLTLVETADDMGLRLHRAEGLAVARPVWEGQKGLFGYERRLRWRFFERGDHVTLAKAYRSYARARGLLVTLADKRKSVPDVDRLVGALNLWTWDSDKVALARAAKAAGMDRVLWSGGGDPAQIRAIRDLGYLVGRYDIVQDVMEPAQFDNLPWTHPDWTTDAWPKDLMRGPDGDWIRGWEVDDKQGRRIPCGVLCDRQAIPYADRRIGAELKTHPYQARFMDTTTATPWRECYDPAHPMTRTDSRLWKMRLLDLMSRKYRLVAGSETGHDAAVPYVHYFEGMLSLGPYRTEDAGRNMAKEWTEVPDALRRFQVGWRYRLPLFELVYHDCVVSHWYWGDHSHKLPALWTLRDRFNALYGTPPLFWLSLDRFLREPERFVRSYRDTVPIARATAYAEMVSHRFLKPDKSVQETLYSNGTRVRVNFGDRSVLLADGVRIEPLGLWWRAGKEARNHSAVPESGR